MSAVRSPANAPTSQGVPPCSPTGTTARTCAPTNASTAGIGTSPATTESITSLITVARQRAAYYASKWASLSYDDALSDALLGVVVAVQQWQPSKGASLDTYARHKMNGYIQHGFRDRTWQKNCKPLPRELVSLDVLIADEY